MGDSSEEDVPVNYQNYRRVRRGDVPLVNNAALKGKQREITPVISIRDSSPVIYEPESDLLDKYNVSEKEDVVYNSASGDEESMTPHEDFRARYTYPNKRFSSPQGTIVLSSPVFAKRRVSRPKPIYQRRTDAAKPRRSRIPNRSHVLRPFGIPNRDNISAQFGGSSGTSQYPSTVERGPLHSERGNSERSSWEPPPRPHRRYKWSTRHPLLDDPKAPRESYINDPFNAPAKDIKISDGSHLYVERSIVNTISRTRMPVVARGGVMNSLKAKAFLSDRPIVLKRPPPRIDIAQLESPESAIVSSDEPDIITRHLPAILDDIDLPPPSDPMVTAFNIPRSARKSVGTESLRDPVSAEGSDSFDGDAISTHDATQPPLPVDSSDSLPPAQPPREILDSIRKIFPTQISKLPFLRRNLRLSFHQAFFTHLHQDDILPPKIPRYTETIYPLIYWEYKLEESSELYRWRCKQPGWLCQLCPCFPPFAVGSALLHHIHCDHPEVIVSKKKLQKRVWRLRILLVGEAQFSSPEVVPLQINHENIQEPSPESPRSMKSFSVTEQEIGVNCQPQTLKDHYRTQYAYQIAVEYMPLPVFGFDAETHLSKEEDLIYFVQSSDEDKGLEILWGRWLLQKEYVVLWHIPVV
ncbi:hypothetical protein FRC16_010041 [Serendipita sp. 398]|nr:hypothetical protein FRC16_010041 [Serendipita sp. 398]